MDTGYPEANGNNCVIFNPGSESPFSTGVGLHTCTGLDWVDTSGNPAQSECTSPVANGNNGFPAAARRYDGVELTVRKQVPGKYFVQASYVYSASVGTTTAPRASRTAAVRPRHQRGLRLPAPLRERGREALSRPAAFLPARRLLHLSIGLTAGSRLCALRRARSADSASSDTTATACTCPKEAPRGGSRRVRDLALAPAGAHDRRRPARSHRNGTEPP